MRSLKTLLTVIGAVTVLVLAGNSVALAATGGKFFLGKKNSANKATTLKRTTAGPALKLKTTSSAAAPLAVNGGGKVANLNADKIDGLDSSALKSSTYLWTKSVTNADEFDVVVPIPPGTYVVGYDAAMPGAGIEGDEVRCMLRRNRGGTFTLYAKTSTMTKPLTGAGLSGSTVMTIAAGDVVNLWCDAPSPYSTFASQPVHIYALRTSVVGGGPL